MDPKKPKITPTQLDLYSGNMAELYNSLEGEIIRLIIQRLNNGYKDITQWQAQKLQELRLFNKDVAKLISEVTNIAEPELLRMFQDVGEGIIHDVDKAMPYPTKPKPANLDAVMRAYHNQTWLELENRINQTLITTHYGTGAAARAYQTALNETAAAFNTGLYTFEQAVERSIMKLAQKGIQTTLIDKGGNTWRLESYSRTVLKSTLGNSYDTLRKERMSEYGVHTVVVTSHAGARDACKIIQSNVVDLREPHEISEDSEYKSIHDPIWQARYGEAGGHRGINCNHLHIPFIPGVNTNNQPKIDVELNDRVAKAKDTQRRIEREIVGYKKRLLVAEELGSERASYYKMKVGHRQKAMRDHLAENGDYLARRYKREKVYTPLDLLLKDFSYDD